ncbi:hypothetical protein [Parerythrobacter aestuarii]|uniref:hypothetical protein n=1 Tax=Parerythrobacter aestuarii TaxID=3020909 RepID=UPI0024DE317E|nr:hypothetical protein [Parerythrobacter aestuarii]
MLRGFLDVAAKLSVSLDACRGVCWAASGTVISCDAFVQLVDRWFKDGVLPDYLFASLKSNSEGALETCGLAYFTGQELEIHPGLVGDRHQASLLALRIVSQLVHRGALTKAEHAIAPDGSVLQLVPTPDGKTVLVGAG